MRLAAAETRDDDATSSLARIQQQQDVYRLTSRNWATRLTDWDAASPPPSLSSSKCRQLCAVNTIDLLLIAALFSHSPLPDRRPPIVLPGRAGPGLRACVRVCVPRFSASVFVRVRASVCWYPRACRFLAYQRFAFVGDRTLLPALRLRHDIVIAPSLVLSVG